MLGHKLLVPVQCLYISCKVKRDEFCTIAQVLQLTLRNVTSIYLNWISYQIHLSELNIQFWLSQSLPTHVANKLVIFWTDKCYIKCLCDNFIFLCFLFWTNKSSSFKCFDSENPLNVCLHSTSCSPLETLISVNSHSKGETR